MKKLLVGFLVICCLVSACFTFSVASARTLQPASCTYWSTDAQTTQTIHGYTWNVSLLSFRDCSTHKYLGKISDHDCVSVPPKQPFQLRLWNQWYINGNYDNETTSTFNPPYHAASGPYCNYSGSFAVPAGNSVLNITYVQYLDNSHLGGEIELADNNIR